ncbi:MAG: biotin--[acetyl-CoA-carboxylase] ligase, partial [Planctomycetaceae bacterium]|nr:biotin--[acetyl-CoA-carboxylase] ligase [Planctomycetaceae bacterium]
MNTAFEPTRIEADSCVAEAIVLDECHSTNTAALGRLANQTAKLPSVLVTECQTAGRGRGSHVWFSTGGSLTFSVSYDFSPMQQKDVPVVALVTGISIAEVLETIVGSVNPEAIQLKWPNDVYLRDKKLGGILIESAATQPTQLVIGIGLNINNSLKTAPADISTTGIAITDATDTTHNLEDLLVLLLNQLDKNFSLLKSKQLDISTLRNSRSMLNHSDISIVIGETDQQPRSYQGRCCGVASDGALLIEIAGEVKPFYS